MIVYFADRQFNITGQASTSLPGGLRLVEDNLVEEVDSGVNTFSFKVAANDQDRHALDAVSVGSFVLRSTSRNSESDWYNSLFQIIETEYDTSSKILSVYAEDAGLELINRICPPIELVDMTLPEMIRAFIPSDWEINAIDAPLAAKSYKWDGENTATERINSVANLFACEVYYTFAVERLRITAKIINLVSKRGDQNATIQLRLNRDINSITTKTSITDIVTAYTVTGGTPEGENDPITLEGYTYSYIDPDNGDVYEVDEESGQLRNLSAMARWSSSIDEDGLILRSYSFDTVDKAVLAGEARAELQKTSKARLEYEVDIEFLPSGSAIGDRINIIDEEGEVYLEARILRLETSVTGCTTKATIGDYILRSPGINESMAMLALKLREEAEERMRNIDIMQFEGVSELVDQIEINADTTEELGETIFASIEDVNALESIVESQGATVNAQSSSIESLSTSRSEILDRISEIEITSNAIEQELSDVKRAVVIRPDEPSITVQSGRGIVKVMDGEVDIQGSGNKVTWIDASAMHSLRTETSELVMDSISLNGMSETAGGFAWIARQNGHLSLKRRV